MRRTSFTALAAVAAMVATVSLAGCSDSDSGTDGTTSTTAATSSTTSPDDGGGTVVDQPGPVTLAVGERATLRLEANPTTGYQWELASEPDAAVVRVVSDRYEAATTGAVGAPGAQDVVIEGVAAGSASVELRYVRPWETDQPPAETATYDVTVD